MPVHLVSQRRPRVLVIVVVLVISGPGLYYLFSPTIGGFPVPAAVHHGEYKQYGDKYSHTAGISTGCYDEANELQSFKEFNTKKHVRVVLIGAGPTSLGALYRLYHSGVLSHANIQIVVFEKESEPGGVAVKLGGVMMDNTREQFIWRSNGGQSQANKYFNDIILADGSFRQWNESTAGSVLQQQQGGVFGRGSYVFVKDNNGDGHRFIPQPVEKNVDLLNGMLSEVDLQSFSENMNKTKDAEGIKSYDDWLVRNFGRGLCDLMMRKYNRKLWGVDTRKMNSNWVVKERQHKAIQGEDKVTIQTNPTTQYGRINWKKLTEVLPQGWFHYNNTVTKVDIDKKQITVVRAKDKQSFKLSYDMLISTAPLNWLIDNIQSNRTKEVLQMGNLMQQLSYIRMHIVVLKVDHLPHAFQNKSSIYFPDTDTPFHSVLINSPASENSNSHAGKHEWLLICEISQPINVSDSDVDKNRTSSSNYWTEDYLVKNTIAALRKYGFLNKIIFQKYYRFDGYPIPTIQSNRILGKIQPWLESYSIYSRGLLGGWRSEEGSEMGQSFMQGFKIVNRLLLGLPEETYPCRPRELGDKTAKDSTRPFSKVMDYEFVIAKSRENLDWLKKKKLTRHTHIYCKKKDVLPDFDFQYWTDLPNVGREGHTYLYHIVTNYNHLADVTVFLQGELRGGELNRCYARKPMKYVKEAKKHGVAYAKSEKFTNWDMAKHIHRSYVKQTRIHDDSVGEYWNRYFEFPHPKEIITNYYGCFSVTRERILKRPRKMYKRLLESLSYARNPQEGYIIEKLWVSLFSVYKP